MNNIPVRVDFPSRQAHRAAVRDYFREPIQGQSPSYASAQVIVDGRPEIITVQTNAELPARPVRITSAHNRRTLAAARP